MTGEETKQLKDKFENKWVEWYEKGIDDEDDGSYYQDLDNIWRFIESEIITPYEKQLEQVERKLKGVLETPDNGDCACNVHSKLKNYVCKVCGCPVNDVCYEHFELKSQNTHTK